MTTTLVLVHERQTAKFERFVSADTDRYNGNGIASVHLPRAAFKGRERPETVSLVIDYETATVTVTV